MKKAYQERGKETGNHAVIMYNGIVINDLDPDNMGIKDDPYKDDGGK